MSYGKASGGIWEASGKHFGAFLGSVWEAFWSIRKHLGCVLEASGDIWKHLDVYGNIWEASGSMCEASGGI